MRSRHQRRLEAALALVPAVLLAGVVTSNALADREPEVHAPVTVPDHGSTTDVRDALAHYRGPWTATVRTTTATAQGSVATTSTASWDGRVARSAEHTADGDQRTWWDTTTGRCTQDGEGGTLEVHEAGRGDVATLAGEALGELGSGRTAIVRRDGQVQLSEDDGTTVVLHHDDRHVLRGWQVNQPDPGSGTITVTEVRLSYRAAAAGSPDGAHHVDGVRALGCARRFAGQ